MAELITLKSSKFNTRHVYKPSHWSTASAFTSLYTALGLGSQSVPLNLIHKKASDKAQPEH
jgi:hypothetical protein